MIGSMKMSKIQSRQRRVIVGNLKRLLVVLLVLVLVLTTLFFVLENQRQVALMLFGWSLPESSRCGRIARIRCRLVRWSVTGIAHHVPHETAGISCVIAWASQTYFSMSPAEFSYDILQIFL